MCCRHRVQLKCYCSVCVCVVINTLLVDAVPRPKWPSDRQSKNHRMPNTHSTHSGTRHSFIFINASEFETENARKWRRRRSRKTQKSIWENTFQAMLMRSTIILCNLIMNFFSSTSRLVCRYMVGTFVAADSKWTRLCQRRSMVSCHRTMTPSSIHNMFVTASTSIKCLIFRCLAATLRTIFIGRN